MQAHAKILGSLDAHGFLEQSRQHFGLANDAANRHPAPALACLLLAGSLCALSASGLPGPAGTESGNSLKYAPTLSNPIKSSVV